MVAQKRLIFIYAAGQLESMRPTKALVTGILAFLLVLGSSPMAFASHSTPFKGSFSGPFTVTFGTTTATVHFSGEGIASHLGQSDISATVAVVLSTLVGTSTDTRIIAADGDQLFLTTVASEHFTSASTIALSGTYTITGGSGHLSDATGSGTLSGTVFITGPTSGTVSETFSGTIAE
jgi:hypothetical protein